MTEQTPVLVWTMGKVGTTTISRALKSADIPTLHMHSIREKVHRSVRKNRWKQAWRKYQETAELFQLIGHRKSPDVAARRRDPFDLIQRELKAARRALKPPVVPHIKASRQAIDIIQSGVAPIRIITMVREPISRNISAFFENLEGFAVSYEDPTDKLVSTFLKEYPHHVPLRWFDRELKEGVDFDVFAHAFDHEARLGRYKQGRFDIMVMRVDADFERQQSEVSDFVGAPLVLVVANTAEAKPYAAAYRAFKERLLLSEGYIQKMYDSKFARHFWTKDELDRMSRSHVAG